MSFVRLSIMCCVLLCFLSGCASDGSFVNPFDKGQDESTAGTESPYYFGEFADVPIPQEMGEKSGGTFITYAPSGIKCGVQEFSGRVDAVSLMNAMRRNMATNAWTLRSLMRSTESILIFEKADRVCSLVISDGMIFTGMRVFISPRLDGESGDIDLSAYSPPVASQPVGAAPETEKSEIK